MRNVARISTMILPKNHKIMSPKRSFIGIVKLSKDDSDPKAGELGARPGKNRRKVGLKKSVQFFE